MYQGKTLLILWEHYGPYHLARLSATEKMGKRYGLKVSGMELASRQDSYPWKGGHVSDGKITLFPGKAVEEVGFAAYISQTWILLSELRPDFMAICGYRHIAMLTALVWAKLHGKIAVLMSESKADDQPRQAWKEWLKRHLVKRFDAALVGGTRQREYAVSLGLPWDRVFVGYDVVDNEHYARGAQAARLQEATVRKRLSLPRPYFLNVSRFIAKKNLFRLLEAYRKYRQAVTNNPWDLVLCGSGPLEAKLKEAARDLPGVHFPGFKQADELPAYYGIAATFVMPSSHFEQWGLVVNEAMASGLPVLVSKACGCAPDLVQEGVNGFTFDPYDVEGLARLMIKMSSGEVDLQAMGAASRQLIVHWSLDTYACNLLKAVEAGWHQKGKEIRF